MNNIQVTIQKKRDFITVSNRFIDQYMPTANGTYVKVYLYLLRCISEPSRGISIPEIADCFENTERDILRALDYWERMKLLALKKSPQGEIEHIELCDISENAAAPSAALSATPYVISELTLKAPDTRKPSTAEAAVAPSAVSASAAVSAASAVSAVVPSAVSASAAATASATAPSAVSAAAATAAATEGKTDVPSVTSLSCDYPPEELEAFSKEPSVAILLSVIEKYLKRFLKPADIQLVYGLSHELHFSVELIDHLYGYCTSKKKNHPTYIEKVAINWYNAGIQTPEQATTFSAQYNDNYNIVMKQFGLNRIPGEPERKMINRWFEQYHFSAEIVCRACELALLNTSQPSFQYTDKILKNWYAQHVDSLAAAEACSSEYRRKSAPARLAAVSGFDPRRSANTKNRAHNFNEREYSSADMLALEKSLLEKSKSKKQIHS